MKERPETPARSAKRIRRLATTGKAEEAALLVASMSPERAALVALLASDGLDGSGAYPVFVRELKKIVRRSDWTERVFRRSADMLDNDPGADALTLCGPCD